LVIQPPNGCSFEQAGIQFFLVAITDIIVTVLLQLCVPLIVQRVWPDNPKPEFNISEELLVLLHRQFISFIGVMVFPMLSVITLIGNLIQYPIALVRLLK
jgi:hypothetical protein